MGDPACELTAGWCYGEWIDDEEEDWQCQYCGKLYCGDDEGSSDSD